MNYRLFFFAVILGFLPGAASAAPPTLESLYPVGGQRGKTVEVSAIGTFTPWPVQVAVDSPHLKVTPGKIAGALKVEIGDDAEPRLHWIRLWNDEGASEARPFFVGMAPEMMEKEPNDDPKSAQFLSGPTTVVHGKLSKAGDVDMFAIKLSKGQTVVAACDAHRTLGSPMDGVLQIVSETGFVLEQNDDYLEIDPLVAFTAPADGTYRVRLFAFPSKTDSTIGFSGSDKHQYRLTITTQAYVTHTLPLSVPFDRDATVSVRGFSLLSKTLVFPAGQQARPGTAWILPPGCNEAVAVRRDRWPSRVHNGIPAGAKPTDLTLPLAVTGQFDQPDQVDSFTIVGKKGQRLSFKAMGRGLDFRAEPTLTLLSSDGKVLGEANPPGKIGDATVLQTTLATDGVVRLHVKDLYGRAGPRHVYRLEAKTAEPDFALSVATDRFLVKAGSSVEIPVTVDRQNGWKGDLELVAQDLPRSWKTETKADAKDGKTIKLVVLTDGNAASTPFRIVGRSKGQEREVLTTNATARHTADSLWLTVAKKNDKK